MTAAPDLTVGLLMPSRGRPAQARETALAAAAQATLPGTRVYVLVDGDPDPAYAAAAAGPAVQVVRYPVHAGMVATLNHYAPVAARTHTHIGFAGDDHVAETSGWDAELAAAAGPCGLAYGDDGHQHEGLPTAVVMSAGVLWALGFMVPPLIRHLYCDNYWLELGRAAGALTYVPGVRIDHRHPHAGKAPMDAGYAAVNSGQAYEVGSSLWLAYKADGRLAADVAAVVTARRAFGLNTQEAADG